MRVISDDDSDGDLSDDYSEAEEVIRTRLSQSVVEEPAVAQDARLVLLVVSSIDSVIGYGACFCSI